MLKTKKFRRLLAGLLAVLMLSVCLPVGAFATGGEEKVEVTISSVYKDNGEVLREEKTFNVTYVDGQELPEYEGLKDFFGNIDGKAEYAGTYDSTLIMSNGTVLSTSTYGPKTEKGNNTLVTGYKMKVVVYFNRVEEEPAPNFINYTVKYIDEVTKESVYATKTDMQVQEGLSIVNCLPIEAPQIEGYTFLGYTYEGYDKYLTEEAVATTGTVTTLVAHYQPIEEPALNFISYTVKYIDEVTKESIYETKTDMQVQEGLSIVNCLPIEAPQIEGYTFLGYTYEGYDKYLTEEAVATTGTVTTLVAHYQPVEEPAPEYISYKVVDAENPDVVLTTWQVLEGDKMANYTGSVPQKEGYTFDYVTFYNHDRPVDLENTVAQKNSTGAEWVLYAHFTKNEDAKEYITYIIVDAETKEELATWQVLEGDPLASYTGTVPHKDGYTLDYLTFYNNDKPVDLKNTVAVKNGTGTEWTLEAHFKEVPADYEDVQVRFEFVDAEGNVLHTATNYATSLSDEIVGAALKDIVADEIAEVEAEGYKQVAFTLVFEDGYETTPLNEPHVVPEYNGKTIKVYFAKVENYEDVNVRFEFVDMDGNTIQPATNYATSLSDSIVGPKVSEVLADEIDKLAADGYDFDHYAWVLADGTETVLTDPVVVPDYDDTTIKVYFVKVEEYEDVHVRFEFVDMDGNSVLPATNYATCLSDSVVGPKVNDVLADELSTMEGRNYNFHHYAWVYSDGTETELDNDVIVVPDHDGTTIKVYFEAVKTEPSDPSTGDNATTVTGKDEHPDIAEAKANGTWGAPTATPAAASTIPQTGDNMPVVMLIVIALVAAGAVGGLVVLRKRSHQ